MTESRTTPIPRPDADFVALQQALHGEYSLERELGRGGMGIVYLARELALDRPVALKVLPSALAARDEVRQRFLREARTAAQLSHPNVVPVFRAEERGGFAFFAMALVDGETLGERVRRAGPIAPPAVARILREVAWALGYAHARGIVHRDIKPDNILLDRDTGRALVTDFGIAHLVNDTSSLTETGLVLGSAHFMSPEQASGEKIDGRSDLYSLGVVGYLALTSRLPFDADSVQAILAQQITRQAPPLDVAGAPPSLSSAIERLMAKAPDARFATGEELAEALADAERGAAPIPAAVRLWMNRGKEQASTALVLYAVLAVTVAFTIATTVAMKRQWHPGTGYFLLLIVPVVQLLQLVGNTQPALAAGYSLDDLCQGLRRDAAMRLEEREVEVTFSRSALGRWLGRFAWVACGTGFLLSFLGSIDVRILQLGGVMFTAGLVSGVGAGFFPSHARTTWMTGLSGRLRIRFWEGWGGRAITAIARLGVHARVASTSHRNTEAVIALAISDLMKALPAGVRRQFPDLPDVVSRLEEEAVTLRANLAKVERDATKRRLADVGGALETIRLDLLRLNAGGDVGALTAELRAAEEFGREVGRVVEARAEVDALLDDASTRT